MDQLLRAELIRRVEADQAAVVQFMRCADQHRQAYAAIGHETNTPWPWAALEWQPEASAPGIVRTVLHAGVGRDRRFP